MSQAIPQLFRIPFVSPSYPLPGLVSKILLMCQAVLQGCYRRDLRCHVEFAWEIVTQESVRPVDISAVSVFLAQHQAGQALFSCNNFLKNRIINCHVQEQDNVGDVLDVIEFALSGTAQHLRKKWQLPKIIKTAEFPSEGCNSKASLDPTTEKYQGRAEPRDAE